MGVLSKLNIGIVGACGRGASFRLACEAVEGVRIHAACDTNAEALPEAAARLGAAEAYTDYEEMLARSELDAVIVGTPMPLHVRQSIAALEAGLHVLCEVPAGVSIEECRDLVEACARSDRVYMMAENYTYIRANVIVRSIAEQGLLGTPYYAEGEYLHNIRDLAERTTWRLKWQTGIDGVTYPTHSLGPILQWMAGDRVVSVSCAGSGHHYLDPRGQPYANEDSCVMLCRMARGGLAKIRVDLISSRPHAMNAHQIQGTDGCYESARAPGDRNRIWLRSRRPKEDGWMDLEELADEFLPDYWREGVAMARQAGHGGGDYFEVLDFVAAIRGERPCPIGIHEAMDMTLPGLVSQQSILEGGRWLEVPDSRQW
jgi:predicted dehydrogenase